MANTAPSPAPSAAATRIAKHLKFMRDLCRRRHSASADRSIVRAMLCRLAVGATYMRRSSMASADEGSNPNMPTSLSPE